MEGRGKETGLGRGKKLRCHTVPMTASADPIGSLEARMVLWSCPVFGQNRWPDSIYSVHQSVDVGCPRTGHDLQ